MNNKDDIDFSSIIPIGDLNKETLCNVSETYHSAKEYMENQKWCIRILESYLGIGEKEILGVFLFKIIPSDEKIEEYLWVVVGDLPPLYLVTEVAATPAAALLTYNFDPIGNRLTANLAGIGYNYTSNALNQYTAITSGSTTTDPTYDFDGNMLIRDGWTQTWNGENRLIETIKGNTRLTFAYDYMGRRVEKKVYNGETVTKHLRFVYNCYKLAEELDALDDNTTLRKYTWQDGIDLDVLLSVHDATANTTYFYTTDANKNVSELTDGSGAVVAHYEYTPFGAQTIATGAYAAANPFRFSSEYYDPETKLVYYNYRYYDPQLGRWLSRDPIGEEGGENLYAFVSNNSSNSIDILGWDEYVPDHICPSMLGFVMMYSSLRSLLVV